MYKKMFFICVLLFCFMYLSATKVLFLTNEPFSIPDDNNTISYFLMQNIMAELGLDFEYDYVSHLDAMQSIDDEENVLIFPYIRPRNMSNRILLSDTLYVANHKVFYNKAIYDFLEINSLVDLRTYIIGTHFNYPFEIDLRRIGLTLHYSHNNQESMQKLVNQQIGFVIEEEIRGLGYLEQTEGFHKQNIGFYDVNLFATPFFVAAPVRNDDSNELISRINYLIQERDFIDNLIKEYFDYVILKGEQ